MDCGARQEDVISLLSWNERDRNCEVGEKHFTAVHRFMNTGTGVNRRRARRRAGSTGLCALQIAQVRSSESFRTHLCTHSNTPPVTRDINAPSVMEYASQESQEIRKSGDQYHQSVTPYYKIHGNVALRISGKPKQRQNRVWAPR
uniref:Uncharacterized protein n=1 Tax=Steinernema glaseri TaxID=37863 RepID=A0A1I7ZF25_9BILA